MGRQFKTESESWRKLKTTNRRQNQERIGETGKEDLGFFQRFSVSYFSFAPFPVLRCLRFSVSCFYFFIQGGSFTSPIAILGGKTTTLFPACHWKIVPTAPSLGSILGMTW
jgi:hypothetical protein